MFDVDFGSLPTKVDIAKLELFATQIDELVSESPEKLRSLEAQDVAGKAEVGLRRLAFEIREGIRGFRDDNGKATN